MELEMDTEAILLGDEKTANIKLHIISCDGGEYKGNPVLVHSHVLIKHSSYFEASLSSRWSSATANKEIKIKALSNSDDFIKCIRLIYSSYAGARLLFSCAEEALQILPIASQLLFEDGIKACMAYLSAIPWTPSQTLRIEALVSHLQLDISDDLGARLIKPESSSFDQHLKCKVVKYLTLRKERDDPINMSTVDNIRNRTAQYVISRMRKGVGASLRSRNVCLDAILDAYKINIDNIKEAQNLIQGWGAIDVLWWLLDLIILCNDAQMYETALTLFCKDGQLAEKVLLDRAPYSFPLLQILVDRFLESLADGKIITEMSFRISFLSKWVPVMGYLIPPPPPPQLSNDHARYKFHDIIRRLVERVGALLRTIPLNEQINIFQTWEDTARKFENHHKHASSNIRIRLWWWINPIWLSVTASNEAHFQL
ncbi:hypothetical protein KI387_014495 [Taxus chinensis]|uniref:BTB domain-containing protein n=1 Tax=Taxus chinensis TaxID=29808 RepID=A0AA38CN73_TAXCH|nr:hypothetical protein KI387_014495 [Taxus chinensis]